MRFNVTILLLLLLNLASCSLKKNPTLLKEMHESVIGQTPPKDMIFIPGDGKMKSFYMGVSEEPNFNYVIYLKWLERVFGNDYPEIVSDAQPKKQHLPEEFIYNDPYINYYMTHPAFSYYPIVGLNYLQVQNYLYWKTDRMNEEILIKNKIIAFSPEQVNEDNFNTEAFLNGQFEGLLLKGFRKLVPDFYKQTVEYLNLKEGNGMKWQTGILLPGFRLPTEAEWVYAAQQKFTKPFDPERSKKAFSKKAINHPFGGNYFTLRWARFYKIPVDEFSKKGFKNNAAFKEEQSKLPQRLTSIADYNPKYYGVAAMDGNVKEWLLDIYKPEFDSTEFDFVKITSKNGFPLTGKEIFNDDGYLREKDSMGRMHFRTLGVDNRGYELRIRKYFPSKQKRVVRGGTWKNPGTSQREALTEDSSSALVGFRCVMNYAGMPVNKKYKVKW